MDQILPELLSEKNQYFDWNGSVQISSDQSYNSVVQNLHPHRKNIVLNRIL
jgi:hypothetical protein